MTTSRPTVLASLVLALALLGDSLLYAVLPLHAATFGVSLAWVGVLLSANRIVRLFVYPLLPRLAATGLRRFTVIAAALGALSTLAFASGRGAWMLLASRVVWGAVFGSLSLSTLAYATVAADRAGRRVGLSLALRELGPLFALTFGAAGVAAIGVRPSLALLGVLSLAGVFLAALLPDPAIAPEKTRRPRGVAWPREAEWLSLAAGFVTDGIFPATVALLLARSADGGAAVVDAGLLLGLKRVAVIILAPLGGRAADRFGGGAVTAAGLMTAAAGAFCIGFEGVIAGAILLSCGAAATTTTIPVAVAVEHGEERVGAFARVAMARDAGAAAGPLVALALFDAVGAMVMYGAAGVLLAGGALLVERRAVIPPSS